MIKVKKSYSMRIIKYLLSIYKESHESDLNNSEVNNNYKKQRSL